MPDLPERRQRFAAWSFTGTEVVAMLAAIVTLVTALGVGTVNVIVALRTTAVVAQSLEATQAVSAQVEQVHTLTNSNLAALKSELALALSEITSLREMVVDLRSQRERTAGAALPGSRPTVPVPVIIENQPGEDVPVTVTPGKSR